MKIAVIADDLTGANATGVRLSKQGFKTATMLQGWSYPSEPYDAICIDTDSRYIPPSEAERRVMEATTSMLGQGATIFCKRIDSTVRGNIGVEIVSLLETLGPKAVAVVMPSFPDSGRMTVGGYLLVNGRPVQETDVANDPLSPITQSYVPALIAEQSGWRVAHIGLDVVIDGTETVRNRLHDYIRENIRIIVIDAITNEQIETVAQAMANLEETVVAVDPGPLSAAYAKAKLGRFEQRTAKVLVTVGSTTMLTGRQLDHLVHEWGICPIYVSPERLTKNHEARGKEIERAVTEGLERMKTDAVIVVTTNHPERKKLDIAALAAAERTSEESIAKRITSGLAKIGCRLFERSAGQLGGCFSSGGDVTRALCTEAGAIGIKLKDEVLSLVAYGHFVGGIMDNLPIVTKGGLVGNVDTISTCVRFLLTKLSRS